MTEVSIPFRIFRDHLEREAVSGIRDRQPPEAGRRDDPTGYQSGARRRVRGAWLLHRIGILLFLVGSVAACSTQRVSLTPTILLPSSSAGLDADVSLSPVVEGIPDPVGRTTVTPFQVPAGKVHLDRGSESIVEGLRMALEATGYRVVPPPQRRDAPVLVCRVTRMRFRSNNWFAPVIYIAGEVELTLSLVDPSGLTIWQQVYLRKYRDDGVNVSLEGAVSHAFNKALAAAMYDFAGPEFREACCGVGPQKSSAAGAVRP